MNVIKRLKVNTNLLTQVEFERKIKFSAGIKSFVEATFI